LATASQVIDRSRTGDAILRAASHLRLGGLDPRAPSVAEMAEASPFLRQLDGRRWPASTRFVSIAARHDPVVSNVHSQLPGADNTVVTLDHWQTATEHSRLPGSPQAQVEIARAIAGQRPTCRSFGQWFVDEFVGRQMSATQDTIGLGLGYGAARFDAAVRVFVTSKRR
jgi:hypothetical protein